MAPRMYRQGDVLIMEEPHHPRFDPRGGRPAIKNTSKGEKAVLALGEVTGHSHQIVDPGVVAHSMRPDGLAEFLEVSIPAKVVHEEHSPIELPPGFYRVVHQREYDPAVHERPVID